MLPSGMRTEPGFVVLVRCTMSYTFEPPCAEAKAVRSRTTAMKPLPPLSTAGATQAHGFYEGPTPTSRHKHTM